MIGQTMNQLTNGGWPHNAMTCHDNDLEVTLRQCGIDITVPMLIQTSLRPPITSYLGVCLTSTLIFGFNDSVIFPEVVVVTIIFRCVTDFWFHLENLCWWTIFILLIVYYFVQIGFLRSLWRFYWPWLHLLPFNVFSMIDSIWLIWVYRILMQKGLNWNV